MSNDLTDDFIATIKDLRNMITTFKLPLNLNKNNVTICNIFNNMCKGLILINPNDDKTYRKFHIGKIFETNFMLTIFKFIYKQIHKILSLYNKKFESDNFSSNYLFIGKKIMKIFLTINPSLIHEIKQNTDSTHIYSNNMYYFKHYYLFKSTMIENIIPTCTDSYKFLHDILNDKKINKQFVDSNSTSDKIKYDYEFIKWQIIRNPSLLTPQTKIEIVHNCIIKQFNNKEHNMILNKFTDSIEPFLNYEHTEDFVSTLMENEMFPFNSINFLNVFQIYYQFDNNLLINDDILLDLMIGNANISEFKKYFMLKPTYNIYRNFHELLIRSANNCNDELCIFITSIYKTNYRTDFDTYDKEENEFITKHIITKMFATRSTIKHNSQNDFLDCAICGDHENIRTCCNHSFCTVCLSNTFMETVNTICPYCRQNIKYFYKVELNRKN